VQVRPLTYTIKKMFKLEPETIEEVKILSKGFECTESSIVEEALLDYLPNMGTGNPFETERAVVKQNGEPYFMPIDCGIFPPRTFFHSLKPSNGITHRSFLNGTSPSEKLPSCLHRTHCLMVVLVFLLAIAGLAMLPQMRAADTQMAQNFGRKQFVFVSVPEISANTG
jgi:hypothetical protein